MKKVFLAVCFLLYFTSLGWADEYWVYIRTHNNFADNDEDTAGRSQKGDIVQFLPCSKYSAETRHKSEWAIIKVSGLTKEDIAKYTEKMLDKKGRPTAYRKYKIDIDKLNIKLGADALSKDISSIESDIKPKTTLDLISYKIGT